MKSAFARLRKSKILVQGISRTTTGLGIAYGPVSIASIDDQVADIGEKVLTALANSVTGLRHPAQDEWKAVQAPMLEAAGVKSWSALEKGAKAVGLDEQDDFVLITPSTSGMEGQDLPGRAVRSARDATAVGEALLNAFAACE